MRKLFNEEQIKFIVENYQTMKYKDIANHLGDYKSEQIAGWLSNNGYKNKNRSIYTKYEQEFMRNNYKNMLYKDIAKKINKTERQVRGWINTYCERKNRIFNENYFEKIDNPNNSYWLGFIYADGWVCCNYDTYNYELGIELQKSDRYHLEKFNKEIGGVHKIVDEHHEKIIANNPKISITDSSVLRIYSKKIVEDLIKHNVVPNKTLNPIFPKLNDYFYDFFRGYIDGTNQGSDTGSFIGSSRCTEISTNSCKMHIKNTDNKDESPDYSKAIDIIFHKGKSGETYNVGGNHEMSNINIIKTLMDVFAHQKQLFDMRHGTRYFSNPEPAWKKGYEAQIKYVTDRAGHDLRYAIDASKIQNELGWTPEETFETGIEKTVRWYLDNQDWLDNVTSGEYTKWLSQNYAKR